MHVRKYGLHRERGGDREYNSARPWRQELCTDWLLDLFSIGLFQGIIRMKVLPLHQQGGVEEWVFSQSSQTRRIPTATQTMAFANPSATIIPTAGHGNFRIPGVRPWQAVTQLVTAFFSARLPIPSGSNDSTVQSWKCFCNWGLDFRR